MSDEKTEKLLKDLKDWLETQGQALEMRVAKVFRENGFSVSQFEHIVDQESQSVRQVDVVASLSREIDGCFLTVRLVVECKYAKAKPWILLLTPQKFDRTAFFSRILQGKNPTDWKNLPTLQSRLISRILLSLGKTEISRFSIEPTGYSLIEVIFGKRHQSELSDQDENKQEPKKDNKSKDTAFEATVQVSKSIEAHDVDNEEKFKSMVFSFEHDSKEGTFGESELSLYLSIAMPVIVINGRLFEGHLGDDNQIQVSEIENGFVLMPYRQRESQINTQVPLSPVIVVTEENLIKFIPKIQSSLQLLITQDDAIKDIIRFERSKVSKPTSLDDF